MKPRRQRLIIERTAYADSALAQGIQDEWIVKTKGPSGIRVYARTEEQILLHVAAFVRNQLESETKS